MTKFILKVSTRVVCLLVVVITIGMILHAYIFNHFINKMELIENSIKLSFIVWGAIGTVNAAKNLFKNKNGLE